MTSSHSKADCFQTMERDREGRISLHWALTIPNVPEAVILAILAACPSAIKERNGCGATPLHMAASENSSITKNAVDALLDAWYVLR